MITAHGVRHAALVFGGFLLLFCWLFARPLLGGTYLAESDLYDIFLPIFLSPPTVWSSWEFAGMPTFADPENSAFYPLHVVFARLLGSWSAFVISAYVLGACFTYAYVYSHTRSRAAAAFAGVTFGLSEAMLERLPHIIIVHALAWFPLILLSLDGMRRETNRWVWVAIGAVAAANCLLAGHPQLPVYIAYLCAGYVVLTTIVERTGVRYLAAVAATAVLAGLMAAVSLLPVAEASALIAHGSNNFSEFIDYSNSPRQMLSMLFPGIEHIGREAPTYVGLGALALAPVGALQARMNWRAAFWVAVVALALVLGVGAATPLAEVVYGIPLYDRFRIVARHLVFAAFGLSVLAGFGLAAVTQGHARRTLTTMAAVLLATLFAAGLVIQRLPQSFNFEPVDPQALPIGNNGIWMQVGLAAVIAAVCFLLARRPRSPVWMGALIVMAAADLVHAAPYRVGVDGLAFKTVARSAMTPSVHTQRLAAAVADDHSRVLAPAGAHTNAVLPTVFARLWQVPSAGGYSSMLLQRTATMGLMQITGAVDRRVLGDDDLSLDLLAVRYLVLTDEAADAREVLHRSAGTRWREVERFWTSRESDRSSDESAPGETEHVIVENLRALPRAWLAREVLVLTDGAVEDAIRLSRFRDGGPFDPRRTALVEEGEMDALTRPDGPWSVRVESVRDGEIAVRVTSTGGGFLVLSEAYYPGWRARVDEGGWLPVHRTNMALQGVEVPAGEHSVMFRFSSQMRRLGASLSVLGIGALGLVVFAATRRRRTS